MTSSGGDRVRLHNVQMAARQVQCCEAGRVAYGNPCPWHGRSDPQYLLHGEEEAQAWQYGQIVPTMQEAFAGAQRHAALICKLSND